MKYLYTITIGIVCIFHACDAFVYRMVLWKDDKNNTIITLSDEHLDTLSGTTSFKQRKEMIDLAKQIKAYGIFEDASWYTGNNPEIIKSLKYERISASVSQKMGWLVPSWLEDRTPLFPDSPLQDITTYAKKEGINCESIEFRHTVRAAEGGYKISGHETYEEITSKIKEIQEYQDGEAMKKIYDFLLKLHFKSYQASVDLLKHRTENPMSIVPAEQQHLLNADRLIDIEVLHALYKQLEAGKKTFMIYIGGNHLIRIKYGLRMMGFEEKRSIGEERPSFSEELTRTAIRQPFDIIKTYEALIK
jgi:hypothetical protein